MPKKNEFRLLEKRNTIDDQYREKMITIRIWIYRNGLKEKIIRVDADNYFLIRFALEEEMNKLRKKLNNYKKKKVIKAVSKNPKVLKREYRQRVQEIIYSRRSIYQSLRLLKSRKF